MGHWLFVPLHDDVRAYNNVATHPFACSLPENSVNKKGSSKKRSLNRENQSGIIITRDVDNEEARDSSSLGRVPLYPSPPTIIVQVDCYTN